MTKKRPKRIQDINDYVYGELHKNHTSTEIVSRVMGISLRTFYNRMEDPDTFTARELRILGKYVDAETIDLIIGRKPK